MAHLPRLHRCIALLIGRPSHRRQQSAMTGVKSVDQRRMPVQSEGAPAESPGALTYQSSGAVAAACLHAFRCRQQALMAATSAAINEVSAVASR